VKTIAMAMSQLYETTTIKAGEEEEDNLNRSTTIMYTNENRRVERTGKLALIITLLICLFTFFLVIFYIVENGENQTKLIDYQIFNNCNDDDNNETKIEFQTYHLSFKTLNNCTEYVDMGGNFRVSKCNTIHKGKIIDISKFFRYKPYLAGIQLDKIQWRKLMQLDKWGDEFF